LGSQIVEQIDRQRDTQIIEPPPADEGYRRLSALAVLALAAGLLSVLAFVHPLLWAMPIIAVGLAMGALWHIRQHPDEVVGRGAALTGMAAAVFFGFGAIGYSFAREFWLVHRSRQAADQFFSLLAEDRTHEAHQSTLMPSSRLPSGSDFESALGSDPEGAKAYERFLKGDVIERLRRLDPDSLPQFRRGRLANYDLRAEYTELEYLVADGEMPDRIRVIVEFARDPQTRQEQWRVAQISGLE
jgi:hypothetical protein